MSVVFGTTDGEVVVNGLDAWATSELADDWIVTAELHEAIPVTPEGPWIQCVLDSDRPEMTILTLAVASKRRDFWTSPPELAAVAKEALDAICARPEGAR